MPTLINDAASNWGWRSPVIDTGVTVAGSLMMAMGGTIGGGRGDDVWGALGIK